jgi:hypothetical protein
MKDNLPERALNRLLRRTDWRFLLPNPTPQTSICFDDGFLAQAVAAISARVIDAHDPAAVNACELAVALNPNRKTLQAAWNALQPGGTCYAEWYSPLIGNPRIIEQKLRAAGFQDIVCYWAWLPPKQAPAIFWVPVDAAGAVQHFMATRPRDKNILRQWKRVLFRWAWRGARALGIVIPLCTIARKPASIHAHSTLLDRMQTNWDKWKLGRTPEKLSLLLLTGGENSHNKAVGLVFAEPATEPRIAIKMPRVAAAVPGLLNEKHVLEKLAEQNHLPGIPRVLFCEQRDSFVALGETALPGVPLYTKLRRNNFRAYALAACDWLVQLAGKPAVVPATMGWHQVVEPVLAEFSMRFGEVADGALLKRAREKLAALGALPLVCEQGDFSPWNIMVTRDEQFAILDWESADLDSLPVVDLSYFMAHAAFFLDEAWQAGRFRESYRALLDPSTFTGAIHAETLARYANRLGIAPATLHPLRLFAWMKNACAQYRRLERMAGRQPTCEMIQRSLFYSLWEEEQHACAQS